MRLFPVVLGLFALTLGLFLPTSCTKENFDDFQDEELVEMSKLDMEGLKQKAASLSIEDAAARSGK